MSELPTFEPLSVYHHAAPHTLLLQRTLRPTADYASHESGIGIETFLLGCYHWEQLEVSIEIRFRSARALYYIAFFS